MTEFIDPNTDVVRRHVARELYCKLTEEEFVRISRTRVNKEAERDQLVDDMDDEVKKRKTQIKELDDEIGKMGRELRTGEQERTVKCNEVFHRAPDGVGWIVVLRLDNNLEVERRPANAHETQRYLPSMEGGILDEATRRQRSAQDEPSDVPPEGDAPEADETSDGEDKPKRKRGKKSEE